VRRVRAVDRVRSILQLALALLLLSLFLPELVQAQRTLRVHFNISTPKAKVSPVFTRISQYLPDAKIYERWWKEIALCQGLPLPVDHFRIEWVHVNAIHFIDADHDQPDSTGNYNWSIGKSYLGWGVIMIALPYKYDEETIKHEMTHLLIYWAGEKNASDHPRLHFDGRCGVYERYHGGPYRVKP
jgi:hypothetical protein